MKLLVKTTHDQGEAARQMVASSLSLIPLAGPKMEYSVSRVFPTRDSGSRSRVVSIEMPDDTPRFALDMVRLRLEENPGVEYVHLPDRKRFLTQTHTPTR